jgi:hypothetical protein
VGIAGNDTFSLHAVSVIMDKINDTKKILMEEQERIQGQV